MNLLRQPNTVLALIALFASFSLAYTGTVAFDDDVAPSLASVPSRATVPTGGGSGGAADAEDGDSSAALGAESADAGDLSADGGSSLQGPASSGGGGSTASTGSSASLGIGSSSPATPLPGPLAPPPGQFEEDVETTPEATPAPTTPAPTAGSPAPDAAPEKPAVEQRPLTEFPTGQTRYTVVLLSVDRLFRSNELEEAEPLAQRAANAGLDAGLLDTNDHPNLAPGLVVVFAGVFETEEEAKALYDKLLAERERDPRSEQTFEPESYLQILRTEAEFPTEPPPTDSQDEPEPRRVTTIRGSR